ncbi:MAG: leucine-rich repeat domain-containing protein [Gammaproteobacteria bacterium]
MQRSELDANYSKLQTEEPNNRPAPDFIGVTLNTSGRSLFFDSYDGARTFVDSVFPAAFWGLLMRDISEYVQHPTNRYGNTWWKIILGLSNNQQTYTSLLTTNLSQHPDWLPAIALPIALAVFGIGNYILRPSKQFFGDIQKKLPNGWLNDVFSPLFPKSNFNKYVLSLRNEMIEHDDHLNEDDEIIDFINNCIHNHNALVKFYALGFLADYAKLKPERAERLGVNGILTDAGGINSYHAWQANLNNSRSSNIFYLRHFFSKYPQLVMMVMTVRSIIDTAQYFSEKHHCEQSENLYRYSNLLSVNECVTCDWDVLPDAKTKTACINSAFVETTPSQIYKRLRTLHPGDAVTTLDFSKQDWSKWTDQEFDHALTDLERILSNGVKKLDFSRADMSKPALSASKIQRLGQFIKTINITELDISNQNLSDNANHAIVDGLSQSTEILRLNNNELEDVFVERLAQRIESGHLHIKKLFLTGNSISNDGLAHLAELTNKNTTLTSIDVSKNAYTSQGIVLFSDQIQSDNSLESICISGVSLAPKAIKHLCQAVERSSIKALTMSDAGLKDDSAFSLEECMGQLEHLDVSGNKLTEKGVNGLLKSAANGNLTEFNFGRNLVNSINSALTYIPNSLLRVCLSANEVLETDFSQAFLSLARSQITEVQMANLDLTDGDIQSLGNCFHNRTKPLHVLNVGSNQLTSVSMPDLFSIPGLREVGLSGMNLNSAIRPIFEALKSNHQIVSLDISQSRLNSTSIGFIELSLPNTGLKQLNLNNIEMRADDAVGLFGTLIHPTPHISKLGRQSIGVDESRALYHARPRTSLQLLSLINTTDSADAYLARLRVKPATNIHAPGFFKSPSSQYDLNAQSSLFLIGLTTMGVTLGLFMLIVLIHKIATTVIDYRERKRQQENNHHIPQLL